MAKKKAVIGFKGVAFAPVSEDTITAYKAGEATGIPYAGTMSKTPKESSQDVYYDDDLYATVRKMNGYDVEIRFGEMPIEQAELLGLGTYDSATGTLEGNFEIAGKTFALRGILDTVDGLPFYFNYRVFDLNSVRFDNFQTKNDSVQVCECVMTGTIRKPNLASIRPYAIRTVKDSSEIATADAWLKAAEELPKP